MTARTGVTRPTSLLFEKIIRGIRVIDGPQIFFIFSETLRIFFLCKGANTKTKPMKNPTLLMKTRILFLFALLCAAVASLQIVHAATITVNSTADPTESGKTTLRDALAAVNTTATRSTSTLL